MWFIKGEGQSMVFMHRLERNSEQWARIARIWMIYNEKWQRQLNAGASHGSRSEKQKEKCKVNGLSRVACAPRGHMSPPWGCPRHTSASQVAPGAHMWSTKFSPWSQCRYKRGSSDNSVIEKSLNLGIFQLILRLDLEQEQSNAMLQLMNLFLACS